MLGSHEPILLRSWPLILKLFSFSPAELMGSDVESAVQGASFEILGFGRIPGEQMATTVYSGGYGQRSTVTTFMVQNCISAMKTSITANRF